MCPSKSIMGHVMEKSSAARRRSGRQIDAEACTATLAEQTELYQYEGKHSSFIGEPWFVFIKIAYLDFSIRM